MAVGIRSSILLLAVGLGFKCFAAQGSVASSLTSGEYSIGFVAGIVNSSQNDMNTLISNANQSAGGITTKQLTQAYETGAFFMHRFSGTMYALQVRPSYFYEVQNGTGTGGNYNFALKGYTIFPILRLYPLENDFMKFFIQGGLGYGELSGEVDEAGAVVNFANGGFGSLIGMGADFCFTASSCISFEGDYRYLSFDRNVVSSSSGTFPANSFSQYGTGQELEVNNSDAATRMGGLMFLAGYTYWF